MIGVLEKVLEGEGFRKEGELSVAFVGTKRMRGLNKKYRGKDKATDVLSFGAREGEKGAILGEIVICPDEVAKNSKKFSDSFEKELALCLIHGLLHILGYEHEGEESHRSVDGSKKACRSEREARKPEDPTKEEAGKRRDQSDT